YCHQKPKFSNHPYCSKTCAGQAATLCNHCHKKPKFQNFDYCGKNCAALANPGGKARNIAGGSAQPAQTGIQKQKTSNVNSMTAQQGTPAFDPLQIAKLVVQHIPQVQALINPNGSSGSAGQTSVPTSQPIVTNPFAGPTAQIVPPSNVYNTGPGPVNNPFLNPLGQGAYQAAPVTSQNATTNGAVYLAASSNPVPAAQQIHISTQQTPDNLECLIPGCGQPVHVDAKGVKASDYCSMRHREEAVTSGLVSPCIMCLVMPQSDTDYFCSRACREESMNKETYYDEEDESE
ncbi:hypothetical protein CPB84DRAFT_1672686, partial [Gymnopilus junonius]